VGVTAGRKQPTGFGAARSACEVEGAAMAGDEVKCPKCGSDQVRAQKRGWNIWTGFIGSGKIVLACLNCGHRFSPVKGKL
jgi:DNA-directed RNA polymerase subunit RPC12/RpoP